jgi:hypothetical protein
VPAEIAGDRGGRAERAHLEASGHDRHRVRQLGTGRDYHPPRWSGIQLFGRIEFARHDDSPCLPRELFVNAAFLRGRPAAQRLGRRSIQTVSVRSFPSARTPKRLVDPDARRRDLLADGLDD